MGENFHNHATARRTRAMPPMLGAEGRVSHRGEQEEACWARGKRRKFALHEPGDAVGRGAAADKRNGTGPRLEGKLGSQKRGPSAGALVKWAG